MNLSVYRDYGVIPKDSRDDNHNKVSEDTSNYKLVEPGDFVLNKMKGWSGSLGVSDYRGIVSPSYTVLEPGKKIHNKYFHYLLRSESFRQMYESLSYGVRIGQWELRYHDFKQIPSLYPPIEEQKLISLYLDKKTEQIDSLIEKIQKKIELLKEQRTSLINQCVTKGLDPNVEMKDSGVEWIGEIPKHWSLKKITHVTNMMGSGTTPKSDNKEYYEDGNINWLVTGDLNDDYVFQTSNKITQKALDELSSLKIYPENSLLIAMYGATIGKLGVLKTETTVNQATCVLNFDDSNSVDFWFYVFLGNRNYLVSLGYGGGQPNISQDVIKGLRFPSPPTLDEQSLIANGIRSTLSNHDRIIQVENTRIKLLKEYRQSLISSVVTGKVRVTEDMV
jgi:type I restriction enzyme S subunit